MDCCLCKRKRTKGKHRKLTRTELEYLRNMYTTICSGKVEGITVSDLEVHWGDFINQNLFTMISQFYFEKKKVISFDDFIAPIFCILKGTPEERIHQIKELIGSKREFPSPTEFTKYVQCILSTYMSIHEKYKVEEYFRWKERCEPFDEKQIKEFAMCICEILHASKKPITSDDIRNWLMKSNDFLIFEMSVFEQMYGITALSIKIDSEIKFETIIPLCIDDNYLLTEHSVLDVMSILFLNSCLFNVQKEYWRLVYSNVIHGESFSLLYNNIRMQGPTLLVIKDRDGHVFGAFASANWKLNEPTFYGNATSFLYMIKPEMKIYRSSGENTNYQYLSYHKRNLPTGLGMGGRLHNFGLWISEDIMSGQSNDFCATYSNCPMLSGSRDFTAIRMEVWGFGPTVLYRKHSTSANQGQGSSILQNTSQEFDASSIFQMTGKPFYSENFPETKY